MTVRECPQPRAFSNDDGHVEAVQARAWAYGVRYVAIEERSTS